MIQLFLIGWLPVQVPLCANFYSIFLGPLYCTKSPEVPGVSVGFHGFTWVFGGWNHFQLGGPSWVVGGLGEVSGGYNLQNLAWTFADDFF